MEDEFKLALSASSVPRSMKHHLINAIYEWCTEEGLTPHVVVDVTIHPERLFPIRQLESHINNNQIVFNIHRSAAVEFFINKDDMQFRARFAGTQVLVGFSIDSVLGVFARENRLGIFFPKPEVKEEPIEGTTPEGPPDDDTLPLRPKGKPKLTIVN